MAHATGDRAQRIDPANEESHEAWNGVLYDRWVEFREIVTTGLAPHGDTALQEHPPQPGDRVLDIGCGLGDTTVQIADMVGADGEVVGIDVAARMIETARAEAARAEIPNVSFEAADVQVADLDGPFDYAFARMGTMFFDNPVVALRNVRGALRPGGRLCMVVWRRKLDNEWLHRAEQVVERYLEEPEESDEPTCGPGPFSMAGADTTSDILVNAGYERVELRRCDIPIDIGADLDRAVEFTMALGPAGEVIRLAGDDADRVRPQIEAEIRDELSDFSGTDGVRASASTWIVSALSPAG